MSEQNDKLLSYKVKQIAKQEQSQNYAYLMDNINVTDGVITYHGYYPDDSFSENIQIKPVKNNGVTEYRVSSKQSPYQYQLGNLYQAIDAQCMIDHKDFCENNRPSLDDSDEVKDQSPVQSSTQIASKLSKNHNTMALLNERKKINNDLAQASGTLAVNQVKQLKQILKQLDVEISNISKKNNLYTRVDNHNNYHHSLNNHQNISTTKINTNKSHNSKYQSSKTPIDNKHALAKKYHINNVNDVINLKGDGLKELHQMIGLKNVKSQMTDYIDDVKVSKRLNDLGQPSAIKSLNLIFMGNPGTGKTVVARLVGKIMFQNHIIKKPIFKECGAKDLIGQYEGMTAPKTDDVIKDALGGVLFIDEAYQLTPAHKGSSEGDSYKKEAVSELLRQSENHRNDLVIILAGYKNKMEDLLKYGNPGLKSRFNHRIVFRDYSNDDMYKIFMYMVKKNHCTISQSNQKIVKAKLNKFIEFAKQQSDDSNGRLMRNLLDAILESRNRRIGAYVDKMSKAQIDSLHNCDITNGFMKATQTENN